MRRTGAVLLVALIAFGGLGSRFGYDERCKDLAAGIVKTWFENSPVLGPDIEHQETFQRLGCSKVFLEVERQRILNGAVEVVD